MLFFMLLLLNVVDVNVNKLVKLKNKQTQEVS